MLILNTSLNHINIKQEYGCCSQEKEFFFPSNKGQNVVKPWYFSRVMSMAAKLKTQRLIFYFVNTKKKKNNPKIKKALRVQHETF